MLDGIEKMRKLLTSNKEADLNCESLMEDEDFHRTFKREELEELIQPVIQLLKDNIANAISKSGVNPDELDSIELIGDSTRMPIIQQTVKEVFNRQELQRTLNSQETIARGCAL